MEVFLVALLIFYIYHGTGITLGYHRLLSHRSFKVPHWLEYFIVSGGYLCFEGSPIYWVTNHRLHHRYSDQKGDPHSPVDGFWHSYIGWMYKPIVKVSFEQSRLVSPDLYRDRVYEMLHLNNSDYHALLCLIVGVLFRIVLLAVFGPVVLAANLLATLVVFNAPLLVNSVGHLKEFGYRNFESGDGSRNVWWVALIALGEGWHNNHHYAPKSARHGLTAWEFDLSYLVLSVLKVLGLATEIRLPTSEQMSRYRVFDQPAVELDSDPGFEPDSGPDPELDPESKASESDRPLAPVD